MQSVCFPLYFAADDRVRLLTKPEKADFMLHFCPLAGMNRRHPGVIPPMPLPMLAKKLGLDKKVVLKRLVRLSAPGIELIDIHYTPAHPYQLTEESSVSVEILDFADWNGLEDDSFVELLPGEERGGDPAEMDAVARQKNADRQAKHRANNREKKRAALQAQIAALNAEAAQDVVDQGDASASENNGAGPNSNTDSSNSNAKALRNGHQSVTSGVTPGQNGAQKSVQNDASEALRPSRVGDDNVQRYGLDLNSKTLNSNTDSETLNVTNVGNAGGVTPQTVTPPSSSQSAPAQNGSASKPPNLRARSLASQAVALVQELRDVGSESRHYQLLAICEENNLPNLATQALNETRRRIANPRRGEVEKPGAYYQTALLRRLAEHNVHVPTRAELNAEPASEVKRLIQESLADAMPPSYAPLEDRSDEEQYAGREDE